MIRVTHLHPGPSFWVLALLQVLLGLLDLLSFFDRLSSCRTSPSTSRFALWVRRGSQSTDSSYLGTLAGITEVCLVAEIIGVTLESSGIVRVEREGYISSVTGRVPHRALSGHHL